MPCLDVSCLAVFLHSGFLCRMPVLLLSMQGFSLAKVKKRCRQQISNLAEDQIRAVVEEGKLFSAEELGMAVAPPKQHSPSDESSSQLRSSDDTNAVDAEKPGGKSSGSSSSIPSPKALPLIGSDSGDCESGSLVEIMVSENLFDEPPESPSKTASAAADSTSQVLVSDSMSLRQLQRRRRELEAELAQSSPQPVPTADQRNKSDDNDVVIVLSSPESNERCSSPPPEPNSDTNGVTRLGGRSVSLKSSAEGEKPEGHLVITKTSRSAPTEDVVVVGVVVPDHAHKQSGDNFRSIDMEKEEQRLRLRALKSMNKRLLQQHGKGLS